MNKPKYFIIDNNNMIAVVYESDTYGRTMVIRNKIDPSLSLKVFSVDLNKEINDVNLVEFLHSMIPS